MKGKRSKQYRKLMHQYSLSFNFREPYQVLLDAEIIQAAARFKMNLGNGLTNTLHGEIKPMITQCCIRHLYEAETPVGIGGKEEKEKWIDVAKQSERRRCGHHELETPLSALECIKSVVDPKGSGTNKHRYAVASQDAIVRERMRNIAGVPLIYINRSVMIMEPMAAKTAEVRAREEKGKIRAGLKARRPIGSGVKRQRREEDSGGVSTGVDGVTEDADEPAQKKRKNKGTKGPNPLSVKKPKADMSRSHAADMENERVLVRNAIKKDDQAGKKTFDAAVATNGDGTGTADAARKRKRRRKPKDGSARANNGVDGSDKADHANAGAVDDSE